MTHRPMAHPKKNAAGFKRAPRLGCGFQVANRVEYVTIPAQPTVLQRAVRERKVKLAIVLQHVRAKLLRRGCSNGGVRAVDVAVLDRES